VHRGETLCYCAGALAKEYERLGGTAIYYGKPDLPIYDAARAALGGAKKPLVVGDGIFTDILGGQSRRASMRCSSRRVHGEETRPYTAEHLGGLFAGAGVSARAACRRLMW